MKNNGKYNKASYFTKRALSFIIDLIVLSIIDTFCYIIILLTFYIIVEITVVDVDESNMWFYQGLILLFVASLNFIYFIITILKYSATLGQRLLGLKLVSINKSNLVIRHAMLRYLGILVSIYTFFVGYFIAIFTVENRSIIDYVSGTKVIDNKNSK